MSEEERRQCKCRHLGCDKSYQSSRYLRQHESKDHSCPPECKLCEENRNRRRTRKNVEDNVSILMEIPTTLCRHLMEENDKIVNNNYLIPLPRKISVREILRQFLDIQEDDEMKKFTVAFYTLFCEFVGPFLLYEIEKRQYAEIYSKLEHKKELLGDYYGVEHLLRLIVKLPEFMTDVIFAKKEETKEFLEELAKFLESKMDDFFVDDYFRVNLNQKTIE